jgi:uncharacterized protein
MKRRIGMKSFFLGSMTLAYRIMLRILPRSFRREYGHEMTVLFRDLVNDAYEDQGFLVALAVSLRAAGDVLRAAAREHWADLLLQTANIRVAGRCSPRVQAALVLAQEEARDDRCCDRHILLGLLRENGGVAAIVLRKLGIGVEPLRQEVSLLAGAEQAGTKDGLPEVLVLARREAATLGHNFVGTEHVLLGLLHNNDGLLAKALRSLGVSCDQVRQATLSSLVGPSKTKLNGRWGGVGTAMIAAAKAIVLAVLLVALAVASVRAFGQSAPPAQSEAPKSPRAEEVQIPLPENRYLKGTLILPESSHPAPAIIMIPGYSPGHRTRDEEAFRRADQEDSGTIIARCLAKHGTAVLRLPIGGGTSGSEPSLAIGDLAERAIKCADYLKGRSEIDPQRVGILGQSIGGFVAILAASRSSDLAFVVTLATPVESIDLTSFDVLEKLLRDNGAPREERTAIRRQMEKVFAAAAKGAKPDDIRPDLEEFLRAEHAWLSEEQRALVGKTPAEFIKRIADEHLKDVTSPMFRSLIGYDATETLTKIRCPALMLFAGRDRKVDPTKSRAMAKAALEKTGREDWTVEVIAGADHFFRVSEAESLGAEHGVSREFLDMLVNWLSKNSARHSGGQK